MTLQQARRMVAAHASRRRWKNKTADERSAHASKMARARWAKRDQIKALTEKINKTLKG